MLRLKLTLGLLATLIILLLVGIYGVWLFNDLGRAVDKVLRDNYDSIKVCHYMRTATARVNTFYSRGERPAPPFDQPGTLDEVEKQFKARLPTLELNAKTEEERNLVAQLRAACADYVRVYRDIFQYFKEGGLSDPRIGVAKSQIPNLTLSITNVSEQILDHNEQRFDPAIDHRDDQRGHRLRADLRKAWALDHHSDPELDQIDPGTSLPGLCAISASGN